MVLFCLLVVGGIGIYGLFWVNNHLYSDEPLAITVPVIDSVHAAKLLKFLPLRSFIAGQGSQKDIDIHLNGEEANWLGNHMADKRRPGARVKINLGDDRLSVKYTRKAGNKKNINVMLDARMSVSKSITRVNLERLQIGDYLVPPTFLGELNYLVEVFIDRGLLLSGGGLAQLSELKFKDDSVDILIRK